MLARGVASIRGTGLPGGEVPDLQVTDSYRDGGAGGVLYGRARYRKRPAMSRLTLAAATLAAALLGACAATAPVPEDGPLLERVRQDVRLEPMLESSRVTVTERDEIIVFGGSVDSLEDLNIIRDIIDELEGEAPVENNVVMQGGTGGTDERVEPAS